MICPHCHYLDLIKCVKLVLHNPVSLKLEEPSLPDSAQLTQYKILLEEDDKFVLIYALFKLKLIQGKTIIFVNSVDKTKSLQPKSDEEFSKIVAI